MGTSSERGGGQRPVDRFRCCGEIYSGEPNIRGNSQRAFTSSAAPSTAASKLSSGRCKNGILVAATTMTAFGSQLIPACLARGLPAIGTEALRLLNELPHSMNILLLIATIALLKLNPTKPRAFTAANQRFGQMTEITPTDQNFDDAQSLVISVYEEMKKGNAVFMQLGKPIAQAIAQARIDGAKAERETCKEVIAETCEELSAGSKKLLAALTPTQSILHRKTLEKLIASADAISADAIDEIEKRGTPS